MLFKFVNILIIWLYKNIKIKYVYQFFTSINLLTWFNFICNKINSSQFTLIKSFRGRIQFNIHITIFCINIHFSIVCYLLYLIVLNNLNSVSK